jgi:hypothetical protein
MELVSPSVSVTQTSMGTSAMTEMEVTQPIIARPRTKGGTDGAAYVRSLQGERSVSAHRVAKGHRRCCSYILQLQLENAQPPGPRKAYTRSTTTMAATMVGT